MRYRSPGVVMLLLGAATYYAMREGETRAERFGEWLLEGTKVLVVSEAWAAVWRVVKRSVSRRVGGQKLVQETKKTVPARSGGKTLWEIEKAEGAAEKAERESGTVPARTVDEVGEQVRKLRLERIQALEAAAAVKRRARRGN